MILYVNNKNEIKDIDTTTNESLTALEVNDESSPFVGWSKAKICCYKVNVQNGRVTMMTPYVDSRLLEHIDMLGKQNEELQAGLDYLSIMTDVEM